jgi:hypothetical protein
MVGDIRLITLYNFLCDTAPTKVCWLQEGFSFSYDISSDEMRDNIPSNTCLQVKSSLEDIYYSIDAFHIKNETGDQAIKTLKYALKREGLGKDKLLRYELDDDDILSITALVNKQKDYVEDIAMFIRVSYATRSAIKFLTEKSS